MLRLISHRIAAPGAAALILGLALLAGCDRLGPGRGSQVSVKTPPPETNADLDKPPARAPVPRDAASAKTGGPSSIEQPATPGEAGDRNGETPAVEEDGEPRPPLVGEELDKPMDPPPEAEGLIRMPDPEERGAFQDLWADKVNKRIVLAGRICKRTGDMELLACFRRTKEHESIVSVRARARAVHTTLVALGIQPGRPVQFSPKFRPAEGPEIEVLVAWTDEKGKRQTVRAQDWLRNVRTKKAMDQPWVFGGSALVKDPDGQVVYLGDYGDFICVSNFASAMLDIPISSSDANSALMFEAFHERIPPAGTPVALILSAKPHEPLLAPPPK